MDQFVSALGEPWTYFLAGFLAVATREMVHRVSQ